MSRARAAGPGILAGLAGAAGLGLELAAARLFAPYFGTALPVWANLIGLVLAYLALGSWLGGRLAATSPSPARLATRLAACLAGAGLALMLLPELAAPLLRAGARGIAGIDPGLVAGSFLAAAALLALPTLLLGAVLPLAIGAAAASGEPEGSPGALAGRMIAASTTGSIAGVFLTALVLVPALGTRRSFAIGGALLALAGALALGRQGRHARRWALGLAATVLALLAAAWLRPAGPSGRVDANTLLAEESAFHFIEVRQDGPARLLLLDEGAGIQSRHEPGRATSGGIWDDLAAAPLLAPGGDAPGVRRALILGLAGGSVAHTLAAAWQPERIDGVEIDPAVLEAGRRHFALEAVPGLVIHAADGRRFVDAARAAGAPAYDLIVLDAFRGPYPPFHLCTREFFASLRAILAPGGVLALNLPATDGPATGQAAQPSLGAAPADPGALSAAVGATLAQVFPGLSAIERPEAYNRVLVAAGAPPAAAPGTLSARAGAPPPLAELALGLAGRWRPFEPPAGAPVLTDDHAPVEWLVDRMIWREVSR